jgi:hypothetical protein
MKQILFLEEIQNFLSSEKKRKERNSLGYQLLPHLDRSVLL